MIKKLLQPVGVYLRDLGGRVVRGWPRFWFTPADPTSVALIRLFLGMVVFYTHLATITDFMDLVGPHAWVDQQALSELRENQTWRSHPGFEFNPGNADRFASFERFRQSIWLYVQNPTAMWIIHGLFMVSTLCFMLGLFTRPTAVIVWAGHLSYLHRARALWYGMDTMLAFLLLYMMFAPSGRTLSLDRWLARRRQLKQARDSGARVPPEEPVRPSVAANLVLRLIQIHLCIVYICSGLAKLQGGSWWNGTAVYYTIMATDFSPIDMSWMGRVFSDNQLHFISSVGVLFTLFYEIGFPFLVWIRIWRPIMLFLGVLLHLGITIHMGLGSFQVTMMIALIAFVKPESCRWFVNTVLGRDEPAAVGVAPPASENGHDRHHRALAGANRLS